MKHHPFKIRKGIIMAYIEPNTDIYLLKDIKITPNYSDTIFFASKNAQEAYFTNLTKRVATLTKNSYQRYKRGWMKIALPTGIVSQANYMMFKNTSFEGKWFYAFITDWEYVNNSCTLISYMIDDIQTWFFDCTLGDCFVEREHAMNDAIGANRIPEPVGSDRVIMTKRWECSDMENYSVIVQASQQNRDSHFETDYMHQGQFNGLSIWVADCNDGADASVIAAVLDNMVGDGSYSEDATEQQQVVSVMMFPTKFTVDGTRAHTVNEGFATPRTKVDGYTPKNKKLLTAPFKKLLLTNGIGAQITLDYDDFITESGTSTTPAFFIAGSMNGQGQIICVPYNYKGVEHNFDFKIAISEFPQCGYTLDSYRAWLAGGGDIKQQMSALQGIGSGIFGALGMMQGINAEYGKQWQKNYDYRYEDFGTQAANTYADKYTKLSNATAESGALNGAGGLLSGLLGSYVDYKTTEYDAHAKSNVPVGMTAGNVMIALRKLNFRCFDVDINQQDARIIDEFFSKYGYQTNRLKVPNISGRKAWNYVKTSDCELVGNIPASIKASIINIFNSGLTFWKNGDTIGDYSQDNSL